MNTLKGYRIFSALICLTLMLALTIGNVNASPTQQAETDFAAIDAYVTEQMNNLGIPGMALGIVQDGQIVHLQGFGVADSSGRTVTPQTPFYIGSVTKSFTALAVMQLVEAGKIDLDAPVQTYLPWFELADKEASAQDHGAQSAQPDHGYLDQRWESLLDQPARVGGDGARTR